MKESFDQKILEVLANFMNFGDGLHSHSMEIEMAQP